MNPAAPPRVPLVVLAGNPNTGKSTLFNRLTGSRQAVVNAPRTTVEAAQGRWALDSTEVTLFDLPGAYDITHGSDDERATAQVFDTNTQGGAPDLAVVTLDASAPGRSLYVVAQLAQRHAALVVAITMNDVASERGASLDPAQVSAQLGVPAIAVNPRTGEGVAQLSDAVDAALVNPTSITVAPGQDAALDWAHVTTQALTSHHAGASRTTASDRIDSALLRPWLGVPLFLVVLWGTFQLITWVAAPLIDGVGALWQGPVLNAARLAIPGDGWWEAAIVDGVLAGVGSVLSFVPLMLLAFLAFAVLEDSGYLARASFVSARALRAIGLDGTATLPLVLGYGCNLPALAGLKVISHPRQRLATALLIPFTSCSARLPVYLLLGAAFFPNHTGTAIFALYLLSAVTVIGAGLILRGTLLRGSAPSVTLTVLPAYQRPRAASLVLSALRRSRAFVTQAGSVIVVALAALWLASAIPVAGDHEFGSVPVQDSATAAAARSIAPVFAPAGFDDWRTTAALASGLIAKELVVATFAQSYALDVETQAPLQAELRASFDASSGGHGGAAAAAFLAFVALYTPCIATLGELRRQFGLRWMFTSASLGIGIAYAVAVAVFQVGAAL